MPSWPLFFLFLFFIFGVIIHSSPAPRFSARTLDPTRLPPQSTLLLKGSIAVASPEELRKREACQYIGSHTSASSENTQLPVTCEISIVQERGVPTAVPAGGWFGHNPTTSASANTNIATTIPSASTATPIQYVRRKRI
ncbi:hypothetical protein NA56DRAFT_710346 [Hyaloscypha hepaticicola]|uniref:Secreted protein n=1 Tax=Hyaloscypha hepaticicola TaxID=2082293 RepID=A0A2J6PM42_9HELO|nr:hypothetical protein NA56DRAFT_710346 [Hyaloscypha hepaticicola]